MCIRDRCRNGVFEHISFELHRGEILSFAGLGGSKRTDVMRAIFGADPYTSGEVYIKGKKADVYKRQHKVQKEPANITMLHFNFIVEMLPYKI